MIETICLFLLIVGGGQALSRAGDRARRRARPGEAAVGTDVFRDRQVATDSITEQVEQFGGVIISIM